MGQIVHKIMKVAVSSFEHKLAEHLLFLVYLGGFCGLTLIHVYVQGFA